MEIVITVIGLVVGSFLGALTYRLPREMSISKGRSICPNCNRQIAWYDNIPVLSYLLLAGKCRNCKKKISVRYPIIEFLTAFSFLIAYIYQNVIFSNLPWLPGNDVLKIIFILVLVTIALAILVIDFEHQIIPDQLVFILLGIAVGTMILNGYSPIYYHIVSGFIGALFLLIVHLATKGKGMGLGDVKLAIAMGTILGPIYTILWFFLSFIIGGIVGVLLLVLNHAKMKDKVAFGPFLIVSFFIVILFGSQLANILLPYF